MTQMRPRVLHLVPTLIGLACTFTLVFVDPVSAGDDSKNHVGFSIGTPAALNLEFEHVGTFGTLALSGMYFGSVAGLQVGYAPPFFILHENLLRAEVIAGTARFDSDTDGLEEWTYAGAEGVLRARWFLLAVGLSVGEGTFSNPQLMARIGALWSL